MNWISINAKLPTDVEVLVALSDGAVTTAWFEDYDGGVWHLDPERIWEGRVTHWMPFPAPPIHDGLP